MTELTATTATSQWLNRRERTYDLRAQPMISLAAAVVLGILADQVASLTLASGMIASLAAGIVIASLWSWPWSSEKTGWLGVVSLVAVTSAMHSRAEQNAFEAATLRTLISQESQPILLRATVRSDIQRRVSLKPNYSNARSTEPLQTNAISMQTNFVADVTSVRYGRDWTPFQGGISVTLDDDLEALSVGDEVELGGDIVAYSPPSNPGESDFRDFARNRLLHARMFVDSRSHAKVLKKHRIGLRSIADRFARQGEMTLHSSLSETTGALACALVVGRRGALDNETKLSLLETGTIHLLSVSGLHLGIVASVVLAIGVFCGLSRRWLVAIVAVACFAFAAITGANPPVVRAMILIATMLLALIVDRRQWPLNTLAFAAILLLWINPTNLFQVGVQLSFISVATLIACTRSMDPAKEDIQIAVGVEDRIEALVDETRSRRALWVRRKLRNLSQLFWLSLCVTLTTMPLTWSQFHIVSPIAVFANVMLGLPAVVALTSGLVAVVTGALWQPLAIVPAIICDGVLRLMVAIIDVASAVPMGHLWLPSPPSWWVAFYYVALIASLAVRRRFHRPMIFVAGSLAWSLIAWGLAVSPQWMPREKMVATFVDVGHGTSVLLEMPNGENLLYDCGKLGNYTANSHGIEDVLWSRGLTRLNAIVLSHADADHYNAMPGLIRRFGIGEVITPPGLFDDKSPELVTIKQQLASDGIPIREVSIEDQSLQENNEIQILHPPKQKLAGSDNANSLVLRLDHAGHSFILPGDLEPPGTQSVMNMPRPVVGGVMMAPHHGSTTAKAQAMLDWARPVAVIVSGGSRAKNPKVAEMLQTRGSTVAITAKDGAVRVSIDRDGIEINRFLLDPW